MNIKKAAEAYMGAFNSAQENLLQSVIAGLRAAAPFLQEEPHPVDGGTVKAIITEIDSAKYWLAAALPYCHHSSAAHAVGEIDVRLDRIREWLITGRARMTAKKTPEERVTMRQVEGKPYFEVCLDGNGVYALPRQDAERYRRGLIAELRESEGK